MLLHFLPELILREIELEARTLGTQEISIEKWGVVCFTERLSNCCMWDRYAKQGRGVALEFDLSNVNIPPGALWKVNYFERRGSTSVVRTLTSQVRGEFCEALAYKKSKWAYEEEWRLLANCQGVFRIAIPIRRVILGPAMTTDDKNEIVDATVRNGRPVLAELVPSLEPGKFTLHDRMSGDEQIVLTNEHPAML
jgi:hypothetical protein